jgi:hypothetical protein
VPFPGTGIVVAYQGPTDLAPTVLGSITGAVGVVPSPLVIPLAGVITSASSKTFIE